MPIFLQAKAIFFSFLILTSSLIAANSQEVFAKYPNAYFVESGSFTGDGIALALECGFPKIYSIELSEFFYLHCAERFLDYPNVFLVKGDSGKVLGQVLSKIDAAATIWLDGHYSWGPTARGKTNSPLLQELESIKNHPTKTHTILIDDVRQFGTCHFDFIEKQEILEKLLQINQNYQICYENCCFENDILVAYIPKE